MTVKQLLAAFGSGLALTLSVGAPLVYSECGVYQELRTTVRLATTAIDENTVDLKRHEKEEHE